MRSLLRRALELEARATGRDAWHDGRFLERWIDPRWAGRMAAAIAPEEPAAAAAAIRAACDLFADVSAVLADEHGLCPGVDLPAVRRLLDEALGAS